MKCILVEDEEVVRTTLRALINEVGGLDIVAEASGYREGLAVLEHHPETDLLFLDVELPDGTGFDLIEALENSPKVIFVTNYEAYALRAFEVDAVDYIQKPVTAARLKRAVRRIRGDRSEPVQSGGLQPDDLIVLPQNNQKFFTRVEEITVIQSEDNYTRVSRADGRQFLVKRTMGVWASQLPSDMFRRLDRRHIVNLSALERLDNSGQLCFTNSVEPLPLKRTATERLQEILRNV